MNITQLSFSYQKHRSAKQSLPIHSQRMMRNYHLLKRISRKKTAIENRNNQNQGVSQDKSNKSNKEYSRDRFNDWIKNTSQFSQFKSVDLSSRKSNESLVLGMTIVNKVKLQHQSLDMWKFTNQAENWRSIDNQERSRSKTKSKNSLELLVAKSIINPYEAKPNKMKKYKDKKFVFPKVVQQES